jgi:hypothetical protein
MYFLGTSKLSIAILGNFVFMLALLFYRLVTMVGTPVISICSSEQADGTEHSSAGNKQYLKPASASLQIYLGRLRESEVERITERFHHGIVEICLTLTVFRQDFDARLVLLMGVLAMVKVFHWLIQDRVNYTP